VYAFKVDLAQLSDLESILALWTARLESSPGLRAACAGVFGFELSDFAGENWSFRAEAPFGYSKGSSTAGCTLRAKLNTFAQIASGELNPQVAFLRRELEIRGDMDLALKAHRFMF